MIEVDCRKCENCTGNACKKYGNDANKAVAACAKDKFKNYIKAVKNKRMLDADIWINKLKNIIDDEPGEYADYCMHLIGEIEAELSAQEGES